MNKRFLELLAVLVTVAGVFAWWHSHTAGTFEQSKASVDAAAFWTALQDSEQVELLSVDPDRCRDARRDGKSPPQPSFQGYEILGEVILQGAEKRQLVAALAKGVSEALPDTEGSCFDPRHGLRVSHLGITYEAIICFECLQVYVCVDGKQDLKLLTTHEPGVTCTDLLRRHHVRLPRQAGEPLPGDDETPNYLKIIPTAPAPICNPRWSPYPSYVRPFHNTYGH